MPKKETQLVKLARLEEQNIHQTSSINDIKTMLKDHVDSSVAFREDVVTHSRDISWLKKSSFGLYSIIAGIIVWIVSSLIIQ